MAQGKQFPVQIVIGAVDEITLKVMAINEKLEKLTAPIGKVGSSLKMLGQEMGLGKVGTSLAEVGKRFNTFSGNLARSTAILTGLGYAAFRFVKGTADISAQIADASNRIGISTDAFQAWNYEAVQAGLTTADLEGLLVKFSKSMGDAAIEGGELGQLFQHGLGVNLRNANGEIRDMTEVLPEVARELQKIQNPTLRNKVLMELFGKTGAKTAEFLQKATGKVADSVARLKQEGVIISPEDIAASKTFGDNLEALMVKFKAIGASAIAKIMPQLIALLERASQWLTQNQQLVANWASEFAKDLPAILSGIGTALSGLAVVANMVGSAFSYLNSMFGTANVAAGLFAATIFGKTIVSFVQLAASIVSLASNVFPLIIRGVGLLLPVFTKLGAILLMNPIGIWVAAGMALVGLGVLLYKKWEPFRNLIDGIVSKVSGVAGWIAGKFGFGGGDSQAPAIAQGPAGGASAQVARGMAGGAQSTENKVVVDFNNLPRGTRVRTEKAEAPLDLNMGYAMVVP